jgi:hypothetical protein
MLEYATHESLLKETRNLKFEMEYTEIDLNCKPDSHPEAGLKLSA